MAEELKVVLKRSEDSSFGFSLLGTSSLPHVIYDIIENSPAAECGVVEAGDVIVKVNGTDVHRFSTKEVLKFLRLSQDPVTLELKRDPKIKEHVQNYLDRSNHHYSDSDSQEQLNEYTTNSPHFSHQQHNESNRLDSLSRPSRIPTIIRSPVHAAKHASKSGAEQKLPRPSQIPKSNGSVNNVSAQDEPSIKKKCGFEAYMMTGDLILNLSRTQQSSGITTHTKKIDSLRDSTKRNTRHSNSIAPHARGESSTSSSYSENSDSIKEIDIKTNNKISKQIKKIVEHKESDVNVIQKEIESTQIHRVCNSGVVDQKNETCDFVITTSTSETHYTNQLTSIDNVDCSNLHKKCNTLEQRGAFKATNKLVKGYIHGDGVSSSSSTPPPSSSSSSSSSSTTSSIAKSESISAADPCLSMPTSPTSLPTPVAEAFTALKQKEASSSVPTSPESITQDVVVRRSQQTTSIVRKCDVSGFRTSRSEDHLQHTQRDIMGAIVPIDVDEDVNSSLNTLLDTREDSEGSQSSSYRDRIVWTYNAPVATTTTTTTTSSSYNNSQSFSSSISSSPQHSVDSPASPTSVSSSIMSSNSGSKDAPHVTGTLHSLMCPINGTDQSVSEAVSNISSPDYQDDDNLLSSKELGMVISDPSDSDSTILVSDITMQPHRQAAAAAQDDRGEHKIVIKVKGVENQPQQKATGYSEFRDSEDELATITEDMPTHFIGYDRREPSPPVSDDGSDVESLHSYHYSPKAVDIPSAVRLAKRLFGLEGFKKSDVSRHLSKNNDFSRAVADEYLKYFDFEKLKLDEALRLFLKQFSLSGETQERERVLVHFSRRYLDCNPGTFNSQDSVHTLTCAIMLLNTDLHGQNIGRKMTCSEFIENLAELNDGENFSKDILKYLYQAIKEHPLEWALDENYADQKANGENSSQRLQVAGNPFLDTPQSTAAIEYKKGYVMRKCCYDSNYKKTPFGKRSWKMFYCTLRDLVLYLHKDEHGFRKSQVSDNLHNAIRIHHALATKATDYKKKQHVFRLQTADQSEYLFQTSDSKELQSWIDTINFVCASFSAPPLEGGVGSQKRFQRPLLPSSHTKLLLREQLASHEGKVAQLEESLREHTHGSPPTKGLSLQNYIEKENYLQFELRRYNTYVFVLNSHMLMEQQNDFQNCVISDETKSQQNLIFQPPTVNLTPPNVNFNQKSVDVLISPTANRFNNRAVIYSSEAHDID